MVEEIRSEYEVSSEGAVRHWEVPFADLEHITPTETHPAALTSRTDGVQLTGTILTVDPSTDVAVIDFTCSMVYWHKFKNIIYYSQGTPAVFAVANIGDPVYYDRSAGLAAAGFFLSMSPWDADDNANPLFGFIVPRDDADMALFPLGSADALTELEAAIMQVGAGN